MVLIKSKAEYTDKIREVLKEDGCTAKTSSYLQYDLHHSIDEPDTFIFYEVWQDEKAFALHKSI